VHDCAVALVCREKIWDEKQPTSKYRTAARGAVHDECRGQLTKILGGQSDVRLTQACDLHHCRTPEQNGGLEIATFALG